MIGSVADHDRHLHRCCRSRSSARCPATARPRAGRTLDVQGRLRPARRPRHDPRARLAGGAALRRRDRLARRHRPDLHDRHLAHRLRDGAERQRAARRSASRPPRRAVGRHRRGVRRRPGLLPAVPGWQQLVGFITSATVLSFGSGPLCSPRCAGSCPTRTGRSGCPGGDVIPFLAFFSSNLIVFWAGWDDQLEAVPRVLLGLVLLGVFTADRHAHPLRLEGGLLGVAVAGRPGADQLPRLLRTGTADRPWLGLDRAVRVLGRRLHVGDRGPVAGRRREGVPRRGPGCGGRGVAAIEGP